MYGTAEHNFRLITQLDVLQEWGGGDATLTVFFFFVLGTI